MFLGIERVAVSEDLDLAAAAYRVFCAELWGLGPLPPWDRLSVRARGAWFEAVKAATEASEPETEGALAHHCGHSLACNTCDPPTCPDCEQELVCPACMKSSRKAV